VTVLAFIRKAREAGHDALGIAHDQEALFAMLMIQLRKFSAEDLVVLLDKFFLDP